MGLRNDWKRLYREGMVRNLAEKLSWGLQNRFRIPIGNRPDGLNPDFKKSRSLTDNRSLKKVPLLQDLCHFTLSPAWPPG